MLRKIRMLLVGIIRSVDEAIKTSEGGRLKGVSDLFPEEILRRD